MGGGWEKKRFKKQNKGEIFWIWRATCEIGGRCIHWLKFIEILVKNGILFMMEERGENTFSLYLYNIYLFLCSFFFFFKRCCCCWLDSAISTWIMDFLMSHTHGSHWNFSRHKACGKWVNKQANKKRRIGKALKKKMSNKVVTKKRWLITKTFTEQIY